MITVLGSSGFIGSAIVKKIKNEKVDYFSPKRNENIYNKYLGDVLYCIGLTADFRLKPFETVTAHVSLLNEILEKADFNSLTYLSSTRVYINAVTARVSEKDDIISNPNNADDLYTLTKLTGESICICSNRNTKIARLSNVTGNSNDAVNFLPDIIHQIKTTGSLQLRQTLSSAKDYISINNVADLLMSVAQKGKSKIYNIASGKNTTNLSIIEELKKQYNFTLTVTPDAKEIIFPEIANELICEEFNFIPDNIGKQIISLL